jgi:hypothetical protein
MKDRLILAEPSVYAFGGYKEEDEVRRLFHDFWATFSLFEAFVELNELKIAVTREIFEHCWGDHGDSLFPHSILTYQGGRGVTRDLERLAAKKIRKFLDRWVCKPWREYACLDDTIEELSPLVDPLRGIYGDPNLWAAWKDLVAQMLGELNQDSLPLILSKATLSFAPANTKAVRVQAEETVHSTPAMRITDGQPLGVPGYLDPVPYSTLMERCPRPTPPPKLVYEDSGHQPSTPIKRVLGRTAKKYRFVARMNTKRIINGAKPCKIGIAHEGQVKFLISDGVDKSYEGYFTTRATNDAELAVAQELVRREYRFRCSKENFRLTTG